MFSINGFILTSIPDKERRYYGMDTENSHFVVTKDKESYPIGNGLLDGITVAEYVEKRKKENFSYRLLYAELHDVHGQYDVTLHEQYAKEENFLGYDVGDCNNEYDSAVLKDIIIRRSQWEYRLNQYGLFDTLEDATAFATQYEQDGEEDRDGQMQIVALYKVEDSDEMGQLQGKRIEINDLSIFYAGGLRIWMHFYEGDKWYGAMFYNVTGINIEELSYPMQVEGFEILDNKQWGYEKAQRYTVQDFEYGMIRFQCEDVWIEAKGWRK